MAVGFPTKANWAAGDVLTASAMDDLAGTVNLLSNASAATGSILVSNAAGTSFVYQGSQAAGKNAIINGGFDIWQRSTSSTTLGYATADRWWCNNNGGTSTMSQSTTYLAPGARYSLKVVGSGSANQTTVNQAIETNNSVQFAGQTVTASIYSAADSSTAMILSLRYSTSVDVSPSASWTTISATSGGTGTVSTAMTRISGVFVVPANAQSLMLVAYPAGNMAVGVANYYGAAQLELGSVATTFTRAGGNIQGELAACKRYLPSVNVSAGGSATFFGYAYATNSMITSVPFDVQARVSPTGITVNSTIAGNFTVRNKTNGDATVTSLTFDVGGVSGATVLAGATLTQGDAARLICNSVIPILFTGCEL